MIFTVRGYLTAQDGGETAEQLASLLAGESVDLVAELTEMEGYDRSARHRWQEALASQRHLVTNMWVVGASPMLRVTASGMALHARIPLRFIETMADLPRIS